MPAGMISSKRLRYSVVASVFTLAAGQAYGQNENQPITGMHINQDSIAREILRQVPEEAAIERFEILTTTQGLISYVGLSQGAVGGVVFKDSKLQGVLTPAQAQAYYACRGYATARNQYWAENATEWGESLLAAASPAESVELVFSGNSTFKSIKSVITNPALTQVKSLVDIGTNPLGIFKTLRSARANYREHERDQELIALLSEVTPGTSEEQLARTLNPEDITFLEKGIVMAYPRYSIDFLVMNAQVGVIQQPSFHQLAAKHAAIFYMPGLDWSKCHPGAWQQALAAPAP